MIEIYVDGGTLNGTMYIGILSTCDTFPLEIAKQIGQGPTHTAEEEALHHCIGILKRKHPKQPVTIYTDHKALVTMIDGTITARQMKTFPKLAEIQAYIKKHKITLKWVKSAENKAHHLVTLAQNEHVQPKQIRTEATVQRASFEQTSYIAYLEKELAKKDSIIKDLLKLLAKIS